MGAKQAKANVDPVLLALLAEADEEKAGHILSCLIKERAEPIIDAVIRSALPEVIDDDAVGPDDLKADVVVKLVKKLQKVRSDPRSESISDFAGYVAVTCYNVCWTYLSSVHPERALLKDRLRYALGHSSGLSLWQGAGGVWLAGLKDWRERALKKCGTDQLALLAENGDLLKWTWKQYSSGSRFNAEPLLRNIFGLSLAPIELDDLVGLVAGLWGIQETRVVNTGTIHDCAQAEVRGREGWHASARESRLDLALLWKEVRELPRKQRVALLLTLRDDKGVDGITLLDGEGVASAREISEALGVAPLELIRIRDRLPYDDSAVAEYLGITRQQVVNLRKAARERLAYRMRMRQ